jgi:hypothetical protein
MGLCNNADIFQERMSELLASGLETVRVYINDILRNQRIVRKTPQRS